MAKPANGEVALWSGLAAFFATLLSVAVLDVLDLDRWAEYLSALVVAAITFGAVYSKERLSAAKKRERGTTKQRRADDDGFDIGV